MNGLVLVNTYELEALRGGEGAAVDADGPDAPDVEGVAVFLPPLIV